VIHPLAEVEPGSQVGANTRVWHYAHVRAGALVGDNCVLGHGVYIDAGVVVGNNVKLQNRVSVYRGVTLEDGVFVGPHATFTNDRFPRSINVDGTPVSDEDWMPEPTLVKYGASIGAGAIILAGVTVGRWATAGAGSVVTRDVPDHGLVMGAPARLVGYVCRCGHRLRRNRDFWTCPLCGESLNLPDLGAPLE
jgi:UDP-2-acetamido-3-amino-2,3-dideoxy-glucuronate N-acetyltransferase